MQVTQDHRNGAVSDGIFYTGVHEPTKMPESPRHFAAAANFFTTLRIHYADQPFTGVFGDMILYYERGNPKLKLAPDILVIHRLRHTAESYNSLLSWEEDEGPCFILEVVSKSTKLNDFFSKRAIYERMGVKEYAIFDPDWKGERVESLKLYRLVPKEAPTAPAHVNGIDYTYDLILPEHDRYFSTALSMWLKPERDDITLFLPDGTHVPDTQAWKDNYQETKRTLDHSEQQRKRLEEKLTTVEKKMTSAEQKLTSAEQKLTSAEQKLSSTEQKLTSAEQKLSDEAQARLAAEQKLADEAKTRLAAEQKLADEAQARLLVEQKLADAAQARLAAEQKLADEAKTRLAAEERAKQLADLLRANGIDPNEFRPPN